VRKHHASKDQHARLGWFTVAGQGGSTADNCAPQHRIGVVIQNWEKCTPMPRTTAKGGQLYPKRRSLAAAPGGRTQDLQEPAS
jgi:hypothetical protein